jgi:hypothetical protein
VRGGGTTGRRCGGPGRGGGAGARWTRCWPRSTPRTPRSTRRSWASPTIWASIWPRSPSSTGLPSRSVHLLIPAALPSPASSSPLPLCAGGGGARAGLAEQVGAAQRPMALDACLAASLSTAALHHPSTAPHLPRSLAYPGGAGAECAAARALDRAHGRRRQHLLLQRAAAGGEQKRPPLSSAKNATNCQKRPAQLPKTPRPTDKNAPVRPTVWRSRPGSTRSTATSRASTSGTRPRPRARWRRHPRRVRFSCVFVVVLNSYLCGHARVPVRAPCPWRRCAHGRASVRSR